MSTPDSRKGFDRATHAIVAKRLAAVSREMASLAEEIGVSYPKTSAAARQVGAVNVNLGNLRASLNQRYFTEGHGSPTPYYGGLAAGEKKADGAESS